MTTNPIDDIFVNPLEQIDGLIAKTKQTKPIDDILEMLRLDIELNLQDGVRHETPEKLAQAKQDLYAAILSTKPKKENPGLSETDEEAAFKEGINIGTDEWEANIKALFDIPEHEVGGEGDNAL